MSFHPNQIVCVNHPQYSWKLAIVTGLFDSPFLGESMYIVEPLVGPNEIASSWKCFAVPQSCLAPVEIGY